MPIDRRGRVAGRPGCPQCWTRTPPLRLGVLLPAGRIRRWLCQQAVVRASVLPPRYARPGPRRLRVLRWLRPVFGRSGRGCATRPRRGASRWFAHRGRRCRFRTCARPRSVSTSTSTRPSTMRMTSFIAVSGMSALKRRASLEKRSGSSLARSPSILASSRAPPTTRSSSHCGSSLVCRWRAAIQSSSDICSDSSPPIGYCANPDLTAGCGGCGGQFGKRSSSSWRRCLAAGDILVESSADSSSYWLWPRCSSPSQVGQWLQIAASIVWNRSTEHAGEPSSISSRDAQFGLSLHPKMKLRASETIQLSDHQAILRR